MLSFDNNPIWKLVYDIGLLSSLFHSRSHRYKLENKHFLNNLQLCLEAPYICRPTRFILVSNQSSKSRPIIELSQTSLTDCDIQIDSWINYFGQFSKRRTNYIIPPQIRSFFCSLSRLSFKCVISYIFRFRWQWKLSWWRTWPCWLTQLNWTRSILIIHSSRV